MTLLPTCSAVGAGVGQRAESTPFPQESARRVAGGGQLVYPLQVHEVSAEGRALEKEGKPEGRALGSDGEVRRVVPD